jgi:chorismate dehydratase
MARKEVLSVLLLPGKSLEDVESASSNVLAKVLNLKGEVIIGDKALKFYLNEDEKVIDLAKVWYDKHALPFVFARLCYHGKDTKYKKLANSFTKTKFKIPQYILENASKKTGIKKSDILSYLKLINYEIDAHSKLSLKRFLRLAGK